MFWFKTVNDHRIKIALNDAQLKRSRKHIDFLADATKELSESESITTARVDGLAQKLDNTKRSVSSANSRLTAQKRAVINAFRTVAKSKKTNGMSNSQLITFIADTLEKK